LLQVLETLPVGIFLLAPDYTIPFANRTFRERHGESQGRRCYEYIYGSDKPCKSCQSLRPLQTGQPHHWLFTSLDGRLIDINDYPFPDADGTSLVLEMNTDITDQRKMEAELARLDRLNLIGEMAASIGHEIRNPMTAVRGFLQMLIGKAEYADAQSYFDLMIEELDRANEIISEYLGMARDKVVNLQPNWLDSIINSLFPIIISQANLREINVELDLHAPPKVLIDENEIRQLILNMSRNAMEAMSSRGTVTIGTRQEGSEVILFIKDEGNGLSSEIIDKLGTPFSNYQRKTALCLGLAVCYSIVPAIKPE
jgi:signal transduction histidine kinase